MIFRVLDFGTPEQSIYINWIFSAIVDFAPQTLKLPFFYVHPYCKSNILYRRIWFTCYTWVSNLPVQSPGIVVRELSGVCFEWSIPNRWWRKQPWLLLYWSILSTNKKSEITSYSNIYKSQVVYLNFNSPQPIKV